MERFVESKERLPFTQKSAEELALKMNKALEDVTEMTEEEYTAAVEKFNALIQANGGEVVKTDIWGKRKLAYEIEKLREGYYVLVTFKAEPELPQELERNFRIADSVLRYLVTRLPE